MYVKIKLVHENTLTEAKHEACCPLWVMVSFCGLISTNSASKRVRLNNQIKGFRITK